jgi:hypothetical protein
VNKRWGWDYLKETSSFMKYITAHDLVTDAQLSGYTDRVHTPAINIKLSVPKNGLPLSFTTQTLAVLFFFQVNQN